MAKSISSFINTMSKHGGMSLTTGYNIAWNIKGKLQGEMNTKFPGWYEEESPISLMVEEAQLPNVQAATGQTQGRYLGENQVQYPYAKFYSDVSFTWMCDANLTPLKFFHHWHNFIFNGAEEELELGEQLKSQTFGQVRNQANQVVNGKDVNRSIRLQYPADYLATCIVTKTEAGHATPDDRAAVAFVLQDIYPYSIDTVPLSYGSSQITKCTVNFHYAKHTVITNDIKDFGAIGGEGYKKFLDSLKDTFGFPKS